MTGRLDNLHGYEPQLNRDELLSEISTISHSLGLGDIDVIKKYNEKLSNAELKEKHIWLNKLRHMNNIFSFGVARSLDEDTEGQLRELIKNNPIKLLLSYSNEQLGQFIKIMMTNLESAKNMFPTVGCSLKKTDIENGAIIRIMFINSGEKGMDLSQIAQTILMIPFPSISI